MLNELGLTRGQVLRYTMLPEILPRMSRFVRSGFVNLPYFMIVVFNTLKILPDNHPYLLRENHGRYSTLQAIAVGANHLTLDRKNIDKITLFTLIISGLVMMIMQFFLFILALMASPAFAGTGGPGLGPRTMEAFFQNPNTGPDLAFRLLDLVFGLPDIFNSDSEATTSFHTGLHALFEFYSFGMLIVGTFIIIYLVAAIVMETAESGVPFGQRFNKAWAPVRLVLFFGLLLPAPPNGINLAQYLVLNAAKLGSNVATNAWITFNNTTAAPYLGRAEDLVATPNVPSMQNLVTFMALAKTCSWAEGRVNGYDIQPWLVYGAGAANATQMSGAPPAFSTVATSAKGGAVSFRFGVQDATLYATEPGAVFPYCGELTMNIVDQAQPGSALIQQAYMEVISCLWSNTGGSAITSCPTTSLNDQGRDFTSRYSMVLPYNHYPTMDPYITSDSKTTLLSEVNKSFDAALTKAVSEQATKGTWSNDGLKYGWAGAGIWFNKIAEQNGALTTAVQAAPQIRKMPYVLEFIRQEKQKQDTNTPLDESFTPVLSSGQSIVFETPQQREIALILNQQFKIWGPEYSMAFAKDVAETQNQDTTGNVLVDTINLMMGTAGLFDMCKNTNVNPLAQLSSLGKGLVEHSIRAFGVAAGVGVSAGIMTVLQKQTFAQSLQAATSFFMTFATIGLVLGFILFYVLPFLPFVYFFFAVMTWVKSIFEAMVGMPLWALAHLKIDGQGMPGDSAEAGYFYILEIFLRPICILIGFLGGIIIFTSMVKVLNNIFYLVVANLSGHAVTVGGSGCFNPPGTPAASGISENMYERGPVDEFFYTLVYTIIVYMIGLSCFKLVDLIPDRITRWLGAGIQSFGSQDGDPAGNLMKYVSGGAGLTGKQLRSGISGFGFFN